MGYFENRRKKKFGGSQPEIGGLVSSYDPENNILTVEITPKTERYVRKVEATVRDYKLRDEIFTLKKKNNSFRLTMDALIDREYNFSFYLMGKDGKFRREDKTIQEIRKSLIEQPKIGEKVVSGPNSKRENTPKKQNEVATSSSFVPVRRAWPTSSQYAQSLQNPSFSIAKTYDSLVGIQFLKNENVTYPNIIHGAGNFGVVFKFTKDGTKNALKCFTRGSPNIQRRFYEVSKIIENCNIPSLVSLRFFPDSVRVMSKPKEFFPTVTMGWVEGKTLNNFIQENLSNPDKLRSTSRQLVESIILMQSKKIAHGDLSSDNIIIDSKGSVHLIDYDGMYVPALESLGSEELGHESFQHPKRGKYYGPKLDNFSILLIYLSMMAVAKKPAYWKYNQNDPDKMLFEISDFIEPSRSVVMKSLKSEGGKIKKLTTLLEEFLENPPNWDTFEPSDIIKMR